VVKGGCEGVGRLCGVDVWRGKSGNVCVRTTTAT